MSGLRKLFGRKDPPPHLSPSQPKEVLDSEASREMRRAQAELRRSKGQRQEAEGIAGRLRQSNEEDHFAELFRSVLKGVIE